MNWFYYRLIALLLLFTSYAKGQEVEHFQPDDYLELVKLADSLLLLGKYDSSILLFNRASTFAFQKKDWKSYLRCKNRLYDNYVNSSKYPKAEKAIKLAISLIDSLHISDAGDTYINFGIYFRDKGQLDSSIYYYKKHISGYSGKKIDKSFGNGFYYLGITLKYKGLYDSSLFCFKRGLVIYENLPEPPMQNIALSHNALGIIYTDLGLYSESLKEFFRSVEINKEIYGEDNIALAYPYNNIADILSKMDRADEALKYHKLSLNIKRKFLNPNHQSVALSLKNLSSFLLDNGEYNKSLDYLDEALRIEKYNFNEDHLSISETYRRFAGACFKMDKYEESNDYLFKALRIQLKISGENHAVTGNIYSAMSRNYSELNEFDEAVKYANLALKIYKQTYEEGHVFIGLSMADFASIHAKVNNYDAALTYAKESVAYLKKYLSEPHVDIAKQFIKMGDCFFAKEELDSALWYYDRSVDANFSDPDLGMDNEFNYATDKVVLLNSLFKKASTLEKKHEKQGGNEFLLNSIETLALGDQLINSMRESYFDFDDKLLLGRMTSSFYEKGISLNYELFLNNKQEGRSFNEEALKYVEKNKAQVLSSLINRKVRLGNYQDGDSLYQLETSLKQQVNFYNSKIRTSEKEKGNAKIENYTSKLFDINRQLEIIKEERESKNDNRGKESYIKLNSLSELQEGLNDNTSVIEYHIVGDSIFTFILTNGSFDCVLNTNVKDLERNVRDLRLLLESDLSQKPSDFYYKLCLLSKELYDQLLLSPLQTLRKNKSISKLKIIPHGFLFHLPFEILIPDFDEESVSFKNLPYVIKDYEISYDYSLARANFFAKRSNYGLNNFMSIAPEFNNQDFSDLKYNRKEAKSLAQMMSGTFIETAEATETKFKSVANDYSIIHIASHSFIDFDDPRESKIVFSKSDLDSLDDGSLYINELYNMDINADMIVISSCNSGVGKISSGEGALGLNHAFAVAGCPSLVVSQWKVDDTATAELMKLFYSGLKDGQSKSAALRSAKLKFLEKASPYQTNPFFWAAFVQIGDDEPIIKDIDSIYYFAIAAIILSILVSLIGSGSIFYFLSSLKRSAD